MSQTHKRNFLLDGENVVSYIITEQSQVKEYVRKFYPEEKISEDELSALSVIVLAAVGKETPQDTISIATFEMGMDMLCARNAPCITHITGNPGVLVAYIEPLISLCLNSTGGDGIYARIPAHRHTSIWRNELKKLGFKNDGRLRGHRGDFYDLKLKMSNIDIIN